MSSCAFGVSCAIYWQATLRRTILPYFSYLYFSLHPLIQSEEGKKADSLHQYAHSILYWKLFPKDILDVT